MLRCAFPPDFLCWPRQRRFSHASLIVLSYTARVHTSCALAFHPLAQVSMSGNLYASPSLGCPSRIIKYTFTAADGCGNMRSVPCKKSSCHHLLMCADVLFAHQQGGYNWITLPRSVQCCVGDARSRPSLSCMPWVAASTAVGLSLILPTINLPPSFARAAGRPKPHFAIWIQHAQS